MDTSADEPCSMMQRIRTSGLMPITMPQVPAGAAIQVIPILWDERRSSKRAALSGGHEERTRGIVA